MTSQKLRSLVTAALKGGITSSALLLACSAVAQDTTQSQADSEALEEIVVTGTLIRGIAPAGTNVIAVSEEDVQATGYLQRLSCWKPFRRSESSIVCNSFAGRYQPVTTNRPNLRNLPGFNDGRQLEYVGSDGRAPTRRYGHSTTSPDPDVIPPGMIERVESCRMAAQPSMVRMLWRA